MHARKNPNAYLKADARNKVQLLMSRLFDLKMEKHAGNTYVVLPKRSTVLPREKPV